MLNRIIERRTRELLKERFAHDNANLKVEERMRLAVELHDTIAQNLTGVMLQVDAAELAAEKDPRYVKPYLETVRRKLKNSSENLRHCLWDLRSRAFDEKNLADAIRKTLAPHVGKAKISIDCNIKCRELSDNSIHAVLCIIRELAINAVRHGKATHMEIDGALSEEGVSFTVKDDGCGFDTKHHPGPSEGHFGLQGVAERVHRLEGSFSVQSSPKDGSLFTFHHLNPQA
jgi:signal transduction histidine kinase